MGQGSSCPCTSASRASDGSTVSVSPTTPPPLVEEATKAAGSSPTLLTIAPHPQQLAAATCRSCNNTGVDFMGNECSCSFGKSKSKSPDLGWRARALGAAAAPLGGYDPNDHVDFNATPMRMRMDLNSNEGKKVCFHDGAQAQEVRRFDVTTEDVPPEALEVKLERAPNATKGGCCPCLLGARLGKSTSLSFRARTRVKELFAKMDLDTSANVTRSEAQAFFKGSFGRLSVNAMFSEVDVDNNRDISEQEFLEFWEQVKKSGYSEKQILEELDQLVDGGTWVDWKDQRNV